jgi:hypothetical protein
VVEECHAFEQAGVVTLKKPPGIQVVFGQTVRKHMLNETTMQNLLGSQQNNNPELLETQENTVFRAIFMI